MQKRGVSVLRTDFPVQILSHSLGFSIDKAQYTRTLYSTIFRYGFPKAFSLPFTNLVTILHPTVTHKLYVHTLEGWLRPGCLGDGKSLVLLLPIQTVLQEKYVPPSLCTFVFQNIPEMKLRKDRQAKQEVYDRLGKHQHVGGRRNYTIRQYKLRVT